MGIGDLPYVCGHIKFHTRRSGAGPIDVAIDTTLGQNAIVFWQSAFLNGSQHYCKKN